MVWTPAGDGGGGGNGAGDGRVDVGVDVDAVRSMREIPTLASIGLHKRKGARRNQWAMTINGPWRLVFAFRDGDAYDVEIVDFH